MRAWVKLLRLLARFARASSARLPYAKRKTLTMCGFALTVARTMCIPTWLHEPTGGHTSKTASSCRSKEGPHGICMFNTQEDGTPMRPSVVAKAPGHIHGRAWNSRSVLVDGLDGSSIQKWMDEWMDGRMRCTSDY